MRSGIFVVAACVLSACGTAPHIACPALIAYEPGFSTRLAAEIADLPAESASSAQFVITYRYAIKFALAVGWISHLSQYRRRRCRLQRCSSRSNPFPLQLFRSLHALLAVAHWLWP